jgi:hypothetical protein
MRKLILISTLMIFAAPAFAADKLEGFFYLNQDTCGKGTKNAKCKANFQVYGNAAKALYNQMKTKPTFDSCTEGQVKTDGSGMNCIFNKNKTYQCDFGYSFSDKKMVSSDVDC